MPPPRLRLRLAAASLLIATLLGVTPSTHAQCFGGVETYEKTAGTTVVCDSDDDCDARGLLTQPDTSVTRDCIAICKQSSSCNSFTVGECTAREEKKNANFVGYLFVLVWIWGNDGNCILSH